MNIVLMSPHFPPNFYNFAVALHRLGVNVFGIGDAPYDHLHPALRDSLTEYYRVDDMEDYEQLLRACAFFTLHYGKLNRLESHNEHWLDADARLRLDFNIPGAKPTLTTQIKHKSRMKELFLAAGLDVARGAVVPTLAAAQRLVAQIGYPVIVKPDVGVGAAGTYKLHNEVELIQFFQEQSSADYFMEEFIEGTISTFDGLTDQNGQVVFHTSHRYTHGVREIITERLDLFYYSLREIPPALQEAGLKAVQAFKLRERFFHVEFFHTPDGRWVLLELNARPPGGMTMDMFNYANDADLYQEWANVLVYNQFSAQITRPYHCAHISRRYMNNYQHKHEEVLAAYGNLIVHHEPLPPVFATAMGDYVYLLRSPELAELQAAEQFIHALAQRL